MSAVTVVLASIIVFVGVHSLPGDPALTMAGQASGQITPAQLDEIRAKFGLDKPLVAQYLHYAWRAVQGDFGTSAYNGLPVGQTILQRIPVTLELAILSMVFAMIIGTLAGVYAALNRAKVGDYAVNAVGLVGISLPNFWFGLMLILIFAEHLGWLPASGFEPLWTNPIGNLEHMVLPVIMLGLGTAAIIMRQMRSSMLEALESDYVRMARAKGIARSRVIFGHAMRNSLTTVVTISGLQLGALISGAIVAEQLFVLPGFGKLLLDSVSARDYSVVQGVALVTAVGYVAVNLAVDVLYSVLDPRVRTPGRSS